MPSDLLAAILDEANLWLAWEHVRKKRAAAGLDGVWVDQVSADPEPLLDRLRDEILRGRYRPWPLRRVYIPKPKGGRRPIGVATVRDRIAQRAALQALAPRFEPTFNTCSFAYRPGLGVRDAVRAIETWRRAGYRHVLEADITECFDSLDRDLLRERIERLVPERDVRRLIDRWLNAGVVERGTVRVASRGVAQGDILSPLLCNLYLDTLDDALERASGQLVRYADDFIVLTRTPRGAQRARERVGDVLEQIRLDLNLDKTRVTSFDRGFEFLGVEFIRGLAVMLSQQVVVGPDGLTRVRGRPLYEAELPHGVRAAADPVGKRLGRVLDHAAARAQRRGRRLTTMAEAFRQALADKDDPEPGDGGAFLL